MLPNRPWERKEKHIFFPAYNNVFCVAILGTFFLHFTPFFSSKLFRQLCSCFIFQYKDSLMSHFRESIKVSVNIIIILLERGGQRIFLKGRWIIICHRRKLFRTSPNPWLLEKGPSLRTEKTVPNILVTPYQKKT